MPPTVVSGRSLGTRRPRRARRVAGWASVVVGAVVFAAAGVAHAAQAPVGLGTASSFAVLAGSGITNTGATTITGDIGTFPTTSESGFSSVTLIGTDHGGDAVTQGAKDDLVTAYNDAAGRTPVTNVPVELGSTTKLAGVYANGTLGLTGTLTLDAQGSPSAVFIFQTETTLVTATDSKVLFINGASPCNVFWKIGSSATFGTRTAFVGTVLAHDSITANNGATFEGRLLARNAAVTLDHNTINRGSCDVLPTAATTTTTMAPTTATTLATGLAGSGSAPAGGSSSGTPGTPGTPTSPRLPSTGVATAALAGIGLLLTSVGLGFLGVAYRRPAVASVSSRTWPPRYDLYS